MIYCVIKTNNCHQIINNSKIIKRIELDEKQIIYVQLIGEYFHKNCFIESLLMKSIIIAKQMKNC
jgi:hypothetical protein